MSEELKALLSTTEKLMRTVVEAIEKEQQAANGSQEPILDGLEGKTTITPKELSQVIGMGIGTVYNMMRIEGFPSIKIGTRYVIPVQEFRQWMRDNAGKEILQAG